MFDFGTIGEHEFRPLEEPYTEIAAPDPLYNHGYSGEFTTQDSVLGLAVDYYLPVDPLPGCWQMAFVKNRGNENIREILNLISDLNATLDLDTVLFKTNVSAAKLVSAEESSILLFDDEKRHLDFKVASGEKAPILSRIRLGKDDGGIAWWVAQTGEPAVVNDVDLDIRFTGSVDKTTDFKTKSTLAVPVILDGRRGAARRTGQRSFERHDRFVESFELEQHLAEQLV